MTIKSALGNKRQKGKNNSGIIQIFRDKINVKDGDIATIIEELRKSYTVITTCSSVIVSLNDEHKDIAESNKRREIGDELTYIIKVEELRNGDDESGKHWHSRISSVYEVHTDMNKQKKNGRNHTDRFRLYRRHWWKD